MSGETNPQTGGSREGAGTHSRINRRKFIQVGGAGTVLAGLGGCLGNGGGDQETVEILWLSSTESTGAYQAISGLAQVLNEKSDKYEINAPPGGAGPQGMMRMAQGEADFAYTNTAVAYEQDNQLGDWEDTPDVDFRQLWHFYDIHFNIAAPTDSDIQSAEDLEGKRVSLGTTDGTGMQVMPPILDYGIDVDEVEFAPMSFSQLGDALDAGQIDAALAILLNTVFPSYTEQVFAQNDARYLDWPESIRSAVDDSDEYFGRYYTAEELDGQDAGFGDRDEVWFQDSIFHLYTLAERDEEMVNDIMNLMWEHREEIGEYHSLNEYWTSADFISQKFNEEIGLHPGAESFYNEQDIEVTYL